MAEINPTDARESSSLRVNLELLDNLMNLAGELVLGRNQLLQALSVNDEKALQLTSQRIDLVTSELQEGIMKTRMQPIANVFNKLPRVIRDVANAHGKSAELEFTGQEVELDKTIIESIGDPLAKLARNAVYHGIESADERNKNGKPVAGHIYLKAFHEAGQVNIEISDDGRGLNPDQLATEALERGLISLSQKDAMSDEDKLQLIFLPGISTTQADNPPSDQSAGMADIKARLEKLGGLIDVLSESGRGTTFRIKLPLTLAIIPSQIVTLAGERYAIPQVNLDELLRIPAGQIKDRVEKIGDADVIRLRGKLLPLVRLADALGFDRHYTHPEDGKPYPDRRMNIADRRSVSVERHGVSEKHTEGDPEERDRRSGAERRLLSDGSMNIAVVSTGSLTYGLIVEQMHDSEEIVVKPLGRHLNDCSGYAGATIMGDGRVALILDIYNLARKGQLSMVEGQQRGSQLNSKSNQEHADTGALTRWLCFRIAEDEHFAIEMDCIQRIERINVEDIEHVGGKQVVQNRGSSLPLLSLDAVADIKPMAEKAFIEVITVNVAGREIGLLASPPLDAVELSLEIDDSALQQDCIHGSAIIKDRTTLIVNVEAAAKKVFPEWLVHNQAA